MNVVDIINKAISERRTRFAFELLPPLKGDGCCGVFGSIDRLIGFDPAYINVTFHREGIKQAVRPDGSVEWPSCAAAPGTVGISAAIQKKYDVEVVPHLICGGQSKYDIEDALIDLDFPRPAQRTGAARRQVAERKVLHAPPAGTYACRRPRAADRGHEPRPVRRRRGRGVPPLEILDRRGGLPGDAREPPRPRPTSPASRRRSTPGRNTSSRSSSTTTRGSSTTCAGAVRPASPSRSSRASSRYRRCAT